MPKPGTIIARLLFALALIVQIIAPVGSSVAMVTAATDPLAEMVICAQDFEVLGRHDGLDPATHHHDDACALCQLVNGGGFAPPASSPTLIAPPAAARADAWGLRVAPVVTARLLDHIRGRAPPSFS